MKEKRCSKISEILRDAKRGKMFILVDDEGRENEGDLIIPAEEGKWSFNLIHGELGQVVLGEIPGRETDDEITLFKSVGNAIQDLALANLIMEKINYDTN